MHVKTNLKSKKLINTKIRIVVFSNEEGNGIWEGHGLHMGDVLFYVV